MVPYYFSICIVSSIDAIDICFVFDDSKNLDSINHEALLSFLLSIGFGRNVQYLLFHLVLV